MIGISFPPGVPAGRRSAVRLLRTVLVIGLALLSWLAYSLLLAAVPMPVTFAAALLQDSLAALSTEGLAGMLIAMLPFLFLDGRDIWAHSRWHWTATYVSVVAMFVLVVVPQPGSWEQLGAQGVPWLASLAAFAAVAMGAYLLLRRSRRSPTGPATTKPRDDEPVRTAA